MPFSYISSTGNTRLRASARTTHSTAPSAYSAGSCPAAIMSASGPVSGESVSRLCAAPSSAPSRTSAAPRSSSVRTVSCSFASRASITSALRASSGASRRLFCTRAAR